MKRKSIWKGDRKGIVLNHGDTFSTLLGSLLARLCGHNNAHVESGLRSFNIFHPFPEELTRLIVFNISQIYFCPNVWSKENLRKYSGDKILTGGNSLYDALQLIKLTSPSSSLIIPEHPFAVVSFHRFENIFNKDALSKILDLLELASKKIFLLIIGHEPTLKKLEQFNLLGRIQTSKCMELRRRYDYTDFIHLVEKSECVITDGGSNQEECFYMGKPCLLLRDATERTEGLGENVIISKYSRETLINFMDGYAAYRRPMLKIEPSPTSVIVDYITSFN